MEHPLTFCQGVQGADGELDDGAAHLGVVQGGRAAAPLQGWPRLWEGTKPVSSSFLVLYKQKGPFQAMRQQFNSSRGISCSVFAMGEDASNLCCECPGGNLAMRPGKKNHNLNFCMPVLTLLVKSTYEASAS